MKVETAYAKTAVPLLEARGVSKSYRGRRWGAGKAEVLALRDIHLSLSPHGTLALVGKSGSGKSTLARCLVLLEVPDSGEIRFEGTDLLTLPGAELAKLRRRFQIVFQHSAAALNPRFSALEAVEEPLRIQRRANRKEAREKAAGMLEQVGISAQATHRSVLEFSGGQRQRIALARALILQPKVLILDEVLSGLDLSMQASIAKLLRDLQASLALGYLFITHDLVMAAHMAESIAVIEAGRIVESGSVAELFQNPRRAETRQLLEAMPAISARETNVLS